MTHEIFNELIDELEENRVSTLKEKNTRYSAPNDALHNFAQGAEIMGCTPAQCAWNYATKHIVALRDMIMQDNFSNRDDVLEKIQDIQNYLSFIWCIANDETKTKEQPTLRQEQEALEDEGECCSCKYRLIGEGEPCDNCRNNFIYNTEEYFKHELLYERDD